jgi:hypothetical protein
MIPRHAAAAFAALVFAASSGCFLALSTEDYSGGSRTDAGESPTDAGADHASNGADTGSVDPGDAHVDDAAFAAAADAGIVWSGNGHAYELVIITPSVTWATARDLAAARGGHLATLGTKDENDFVMSWLKGHPEAFTEADVGPWLGGYQPNPSPADEPAGGWAWIDGTPWVFTAWHSGQPDNTDGVENYLTAFNRGGEYGWNDDRPTGTSAPIFSYILEVP